MLRTIIAFCVLSVCASPAFSQATTRTCPTDTAIADTPGPACLIAHQEIGSLNTAPLGDQPIFWHIDTFETDVSALAAKTSLGTVVNAFGKTWLFTIGPKDWRANGGTHLADIGPLPVDTRDGDFSAEYLRSTFSPGMTAPLHVHSGPEAFYAMSGDTCLETPDGVQMAKGAGNSLFIRGGPPMLLVATGTETRRGFALILHDSQKPPTTMIHDWTPKGLCKAS
jgi:quercetin dioxygenase-like cupin family protein